MTLAEITQFVNGLFESRIDLSVFKNHIRDFLVQSKEFSAQDNRDLYAEEAAAQVEREWARMLSIPGLIAPNDIQDRMVDSLEAILAEGAKLVTLNSGGVLKMSVHLIASRLMYRILPIP